MLITGKSTRVTVCDCCGKRNLKSTIRVSNGEHYGCVCAPRILGIEPARIELVCRALSRLEWALGSPANRLDDVPSEIRREFPEVCWFADGVLYIDNADLRPATAAGMEARTKRIEYSERLELERRAAASERYSAA